MRLTLRWKLLLSFWALTLLVMLTGWMSLSTSSNLHSTINSLADEITPNLNLLGKIRASTYNFLEATSSYMLEITLSDERQSVEAADEYIELLQAQEELTDTLKEYAQTKRNSYAEKQLTLLQNKVDLLILEVQAFLKLAEGAQPRDALSVRKRIEKIEREINFLTIDAITSEHRDLGKTVSKAQQQTERIVDWTYKIILIAILSSLLLGLFLTYSFANPIIKLRKAVESFGKGEKNIAFPKTSDDEIGQLTRSFNEMASSLRESTVSRKFMDSILTTMHEGLLVFDEDLIVQFANTSALRMLSYEAHELHELKLKDIFGPEIYAHARFEQLTGEGEIKTKKSESILVQYNFQSASNNEADRKYLVCTFRDIRTQRALEDDIIAHKERLTQSEKLASLGTLGAIVAHRLSQPLTAIRLFIQQSIKALSKSECPEHVKDNLAECLKEVSRASIVVKDVLLQTRRAQDRSLENVNLLEIANKTVLVLNSKAKAQSVSIILENFERDISVIGSRIELEELFYLLVHNGIQANNREHPQSINISCVRKSSMVELTFSDSCGGIADQDVDKIFDMFFTTKEIGQGTGLGLSIAKQIVANQSGQIKVFNNGKGATFVIAMPLSQKDEYESNERST